MKTYQKQESVTEVIDPSIDQILGDIRFQIDLFFFIQVSPFTLKEAGAASHQVIYDLIIQIFVLLSPQSSVTDASAAR